MKIFALVALALLPVALGTPIINDTGTATEKPAPDFSAEYLVTGDPSLMCRTQPNTWAGIPVRQYPYGSVVTATCWSAGEFINGNS